MLTGDDAAQQVFDLQFEYKWTAKTSSLQSRKAKLSRLRDEVAIRAGDILQALHKDLGKPLGDPFARENVLTAIDEAVERLEEWATPSTVEPSPTLGRIAPTVEYEARGVCLIFGPWNMPFQLLLEPLVPAIAAGNTAILHPNELTPGVARISTEIVRAVFEEREVAIVEGGVEVATRLLELPVDHIFFTGSPTVGKIVMRAAADHLTSVTLELGGKCPAIIDGTHDVAQTASLVAVGRHANSGQLCLATDHAWVRRDHLSEFLEHYNAWIDANLYREGQLDPAATAHIVNERNMLRILSYVDDARDRGARIIRGGRRSTVADDLIEPTIILDAPLDSKIMTEEIFGPVLPVQTYTDLDDLLDCVRRGPKPLAMYVFSDEPSFVDAVLAGTSSGGVTVNGFATHIAESRLPFGGVNNSGTGRYHGIHGFREFSNQRSIVRHLRTPAPRAQSEPEATIDISAASNKSAAPRDDKAG
jgi:aldehyde dehydrogenase (NAD+)